MVHAPTKDFVMTQLAHAYVIQDLREAAVKVNSILQYSNSFEITKYLVCIYSFSYQINHAQVEILHAVEMDNVTIQQDYALAIREIKGVIVLVILNYLTFMVFCIVL